MIRLDTQDAGFAAAFGELVDARRESDADVARDVQVILRAVRDDGEAAVAALPGLMFVTASASALRYWQLDRRASGG